MRKLLEKLVGLPPAPASARSVYEPRAWQLQRLAYLEAAQRGAPLDFHASALLGGLQVAEQPFLQLYENAMRDTATVVSDWKRLRRIMRAYHLARYAELTRNVPGARAECGVLRGFSALLVARVLRLLQKDFSGAGMFLLDSFEGLSAMHPADAVRAPTDEAGNETRAFFMDAGTMSVPLEVVRGALREFPEIMLVKGWIPDGFAHLPEQSWSFVHIDVDLYEPTLESLAYFVPRLSSGGIVINDDYASPAFPGGGQAWDEYFTENKLPFVALDTGQAVYVAP